MISDMTDTRLKIPSLPGGGYRGHFPYMYFNNINFQCELSDIKWGETQLRHLKISGFPALPAGL